MNKADAKPGVKVIASIDHGDEYDNDGPQVVRYHPDECYGDNDLVGVILDKPAEKGKVFVKWEEGDFEEDEMELDLKVLSLESDKSALESEFKIAEKEIKAKMTEAANMVKEASKLAEKAGVRNLSEMYNAVRPLINSMDNSGWRSSSWGC